MVGGVVVLYSSNMGVTTDRSASESPPTDEHDDSERSSCGSMDGRKASWTLLKYGEKDAVCVSIVVGCGQMRRDYVELMVVRTD